MRISHRIKECLRNSVLYRPLKNLRATLGVGTYSLPFSHTEMAEPFLDRAIQRMGCAPKMRDMAEFYSYFSEIWGDGYETTLQKQYSSYLPHLESLPSGRFLDMGCGAGEFVSFLTQHGFAAEGLDQDAQEVERARTAGLIVHQGDILDFLRTTAAPYAGISLLEVVEHIPQNLLPELLQEIYENLMPGGIALLETVNVKHPLAFHTFYTDPTHQRPVPSDFLIFLLQWVGFVDCKIVYTTPVAYTLSQYHEPGRAYCNYAIVASKPNGNGVSV